MPKPLNVDWPAVRVLAVAVGVREAAGQMGISQDAVRQRSKREGWMASRKTAAQRAATDSLSVFFRRKKASRTVNPLLAQLTLN
jgi:hypothetical protein